MPKLLICKTCQQSPDFANKVTSAIAKSDAAKKITVEEVDCMNVCKDPVTVGLQGEKMASYVFSGVDERADIPDLVATCQTYLKSDKGWIEDARPCGSLREKLVARLPALLD